MASPFLFFIYQFSWTQRDAQRYGFPILREHGFIPLAMTMQEYRMCALTPRMIVLLVSYSVSTWWVYRLVTTRGHAYTLENVNALPPIPVTWGRRLDAIGQPRRVANWLFRRLPTRWVGVRPPDLVLCGGTASAWKGVML